MAYRLNAVKKKLRKHQQYQALKTNLVIVVFGIIGIVLGLIVVSWTMPNHPILQVFK